jgi:hypothetical protein
MAYASKQGRARVNPSSPRAAGICDRCGFVYQFSDLKWQYDWRGASLQNLRFLVCNDCYDTPQEQLRAIVVPADPVPIEQARIQDFAAASTDYQTITQPTVYDPTTGIPIPSTTTLLTQDGQNLTTQPLGPNALPVRPFTGLEPGAIMPLQNNTGAAVAYDVLLPVVSVSSIGTTVISVTCSKPHGLQTNAQISVEGVSNVVACGFYNVTPTTATAFTYMVNSIIPAGSLLTGTTRILTANVGVPYNYSQIPQTGT